MYALYSTVHLTTELDSGLALDRLERADREIFARVRDCYHARLARVLVLLVAALGVSEIPTISEQDLDDLPRRHLFSVQPMGC